MNISQVKQCYGCMGCLNKCPKSSIKVIKDSLGYAYPKVDETCIDCGLCLKVCQAVNNMCMQYPIKVWASWLKDEEMRLKSSSGGIATAISEYIINNNGAVYGCAFEMPFDFKHIRCDTLKDINRLRGSKYVQSEISGTYRNIANDLRSGKKVLFIGTPCQVAAIKYFFGKANNLYTLDLICHGVPSVELLKKSLPFGLLSYGVDNLEFRSNNNFCLCARKEGVKIYSRALRKDLYLKGFFKALFYRNNCYSCQYAKSERIGDITLGDFWGVKLEDIDISKGISLCLVNSSKGIELFDSISDKVDRIERPYEEAISGNKQLKHAMPKSLRAKIFRTLYPMLGFKWSVICSIPEVIIKNILLK